MGQERGDENGFKQCDAQGAFRSSLRPKTLSGFGTKIGRDHLLLTSWLGIHPRTSKVSVYRAPKRVPAFKTVQRAENADGFARCHERAACTAFVRANYFIRQRQSRHRKYDPLDKHRAALDCTRGTQDLGS